jgi:hypothetical protein
MAFTAPLSYGTLVLLAAGVGADSVDEDDSPDLAGLNGVVILKPTVDLWRQESEGQFRILAAQTLRCRLVDGVLLGPDGETAVRILATDSSGLSPSTFQWTATFTLENVATQPPPVTFNLPAGTEVDLATVVSVSVQPGVVTVVSEQTRIAAEAAADRAEAAADRAEAAGGGGGGGEGGDGTDPEARRQAAAAQQRADDAYSLASLAYVLPAAGIPGVNLAAAVRASLALADSAIQQAALSSAIATRVPTGTTITPGTGLTGGGDLSTSRTLGLTAAAIASLGRADSAVQPAALTSGLASKADLVNGLVPSSQLPSIAITDVVVVSDQAAMLALTSTDVQRGDLAVRTDGAGTFILGAGSPSDLASWTKLNSPADLVSSVNGQVGTVVLGKGDVGLGNVSNLAPADLPVSTATQSALDGKAPASHQHTASQISDSTSFGRGVVTAASASAARAAIGAGTSDLALGTTSGTAKRGDYQPAAADISDATATGRSVVTAASQSAARTALGITGTGADGPQGLTGGVLLLPAGSTTTPTDTKAGTLVLIRA